VKNKKKNEKKEKEKEKGKEYEGDTNILTHRFLLHTHDNTQGIEEYKGITA
jgi:hypothetical protein